MSLAKRCAGGGLTAAKKAQPMPPRSSRTGALSASRLSLRMSSYLSNGDEKLFGSLVAGHIVPKNRRRMCPD